jgi:hypothetical protein
MIMRLSLHREVSSDPAALRSRNLKGSSLGKCKPPLKKSSTQTGLSNEKRDEYQISQAKNNEN